MLIKAGFSIQVIADAPTPMTALLSVHPSRFADLRSGHQIVASPDVPVDAYADPFGNMATRLTIPAGGVSLSAEFLIEDSGLPDVPAPNVPVTPLEELPHDVLPFLLGSRYCETDRLMGLAWSLFGAIPTASERLSAIVDWVHHHIRFGYEYARNNRTAWEGYQEGVGVCRDFAHLAVTLCRCVNIPARYCTGYLGDIGVPPVDAPMDFSAWFDAYVDGAWYTYDARHNQPRIGRVLMARGRDATDVAIMTIFGPSSLQKFEVTTLEMTEPSERLSIAA
ncbi:MAG: transglutaminase family protein [Sphingomonas sp.]